MQLFFIPSVDAGSATFPLDIYVSAANGNDANAGLTPATAVQTLAAAWALVPEEIDGVVRIHVGAGSYAWSAPKAPHMLSPAARVYLVGDGAGQAGDDGFTTVVSGTAQAGTSTTSLVLEAAATANAYWGLTLIANNRYTGIRSNSAAAATLNATLTGLANGVAYRIARPAAQITLTKQYTNEDPNAISGFDGLFLVNVAFVGGTTRTTLLAEQSFVGAYGVLFNPGAFHFKNCTVEAGATSAHARVLSDLSWTIASLNGWGFGNRNDATADYVTTHTFESTTFDSDDYHFMNAMYFNMQGSSIKSLCGGSYYGGYIESSFFHTYGYTNFYGVDSYIFVSASSVYLYILDLSELTWAGTTLELSSSYAYLYTPAITGRTNGVVLQESGHTQVISGGTITASSQTVDAIRVTGGGRFDLSSVVTCTGQVNATYGGNIVTSAALTASGLKASYNGSLVLGANATIAPAASTCVTLAGGNLTITSGTLTLTAGANVAVDASDGAKMSVAGGTVTATCTNASYTARFNGSSLTISSGTLTLPNTGGGIGLLLDAASRFTQQAGTSSISTNTNATGATVVRGASSFGVAGGTFSSTAGTGNGDALRCFEASRASFAISPTLTGGSGGTGAGINVRGGGYVTLDNDPTAGVTGSGGAAGAINVTGALAAVGALNGSYGAVVDATTLSGIARAA